MRLNSTRFLVMVLMTVALGSVAAVALVATLGFDHIRRTEEREISRGVGLLKPAYELEIAEKQESVVMEAFLLTGDLRVLDAWDKSEHGFIRIMDDLKAKGYDDELMRGLRALDDQDEHVKTYTVALWQAGRMDQARSYYMQQGRSIKADISRQVDRVLAKQKQELAAMHEEVLRVERDCMLWILVLAAALPPLVLALALLVYRRVVVPLQEVEKASMAIAAGQLAIRMPVGPSEELGNVAIAFNKMASTVQDTFEELRKQDRFKDEFLAVVSHELRTPLNYIKGFASLLEAGPLAADQRRYVGDIHSASERMLRMVNDLLDGAAVQAGKLAVQVDEVDYARLVEDVLGQVRPLAERKRQVLRAEIGALGLVRLDDQRIQQVLTNLLANAIKFTPSGGTIAVGVFRRADEVVTEVVDTGVGIDPRVLPRLFQRFAQLDMSTTRRSGGTGLGLWICKGIVEAHGGRIEVRSQPSVGSTFAFALPQAA
jgi:signal transduction histidine kinase